MDVYIFVALFFVLLYFGLGLPSISCRFHISFFLLLVDSFRPRCEFNTYFSFVPSAPPAPPLLPPPPPSPVHPAWAAKAAGIKMLWDALCVMRRKLDAVKKIRDVAAIAFFEEGGDRSAEGREGREGGNRVQECGEEVREKG